MATFNTQTTYNRTYEKKVIEENPRVVRSGSPFGTQSILSNLPPIPNLPAGFPAIPSFHPTFTSTQSTSSRTVSTNVGTLQQSDDAVHLSINVADYKAEELKVSVIGDSIVIEARHGERTDELGSIERKVPLPRGCPPEAVTSSLASDGILTVSAVVPKKESSPARSIPIKVVNANAAQPASSTDAH